ncbi:unnamed protein product [Allacma fusca]|uniref:CRAL-TRIO domain-containing protein n=1 Tax=Allacma fusca TaxID=39272 RepID=A0A8J2L0F5_9HEXA|nr:unnamed protein product [Allacma fusca]
MTHLHNSGFQTRLTLEDILESAEYKFFLKPAIRNSTQLDDQEYLNLFLELQTWEAPQYIQEGFKYSFGGYDTQNRPIWMSTIAKYPYKEALNGGDADVLERFIWKRLLWMIKSIVAKSPEENPTQQALFINNYEGFSLGQLLHGPTMAFRRKMAGKYKDIVPEILGQVNRISAWLLNLFRPFIGKSLEKVELFGKDESKWRPRLQELFGREEIPSFDEDIYDFPQTVLVM